MLPLGLFRSRTFAATSAIGLLVNIAFYGLIFVFSLYFQTSRHYSRAGHRPGLRTHHRGCPGRRT